MLKEPHCQLFFTLVHVFIMDLNVVIPVRPALLVEEAERVKEFMVEDAIVPAARIQAQNLATANGKADISVTTVASTL